MSSIPKTIQLPLFTLDKRCSKCGMVKALTAFCRHPKMRDGHQSNCKACNCAQKKAAYRADPEGINAIRRERRKKNPTPYKETAQKSWRRHRDKRIAELNRYYYRNRAAALAEKKRYYQEKRAAIRAAAAARYPAIREKALAYNARWRAGSGAALIQAYNQSARGKATAARSRHKRRLHNKAVPNTLTEREWAEILEEQAYTCLHCRRPFSATLKPTRDHIIPVSRGGGLTRENVAALCQSCNSRKWTN